MKKRLPKSKGKIHFNRFNIPYRIYGQGDDIICLNGVQQSSAMWLSFLKYFGSDYRITLFDFPHQGKAEVKKGINSVSLDEQVDILHKVVDELEIKAPTICSASWGGVVALAFALKFPQEVKRLILASIGLKPNQKMRSAILEGTAIEDSQRQKMADVLINSFGNGLPERVKKQIITQFKSMSEDRVKAFSEHGLSVLFKGSLEKVLPLSKIKTPITIIYGAEDMIIDYEDADKLAKKLPDAQIKVIDKVGHFLHLEDENILKFYEQILAS